MVFEAWKERAERLEREVYTLYFAFRDGRTALTAKAVIAVIVAYAISPIDPIPDVIPGLGYIDELIVLPIGVAIALWLIPEEIIAECRDRAEEEINVGAIRWLIAGVVVVIWLLMGTLALQLLNDWL
ncbi:MAG: YkvA family protein [Halobacteriales archaeon]